MKHTMELVWHSCTDCLPSEEFNNRLYITDGVDIFPASWVKNDDWQLFVSSGGCWYVEPGVNSEGFWWADLLQTIGKFEPFIK